MTATPEVGSLDQVPVRRRPQTDKRLAEFGRLLAEARAETGYTLDNLAARATTDRTTISNLENGLSDPHLTTVVKLARAMRIDPARLVRPLVDIPDPEEDETGGS